MVDIAVTTLQETTHAIHCYRQTVFILSLIGTVYFEHGGNKQTYYSREVKGHLQY